MNRISNVIIIYLLIVILLILYNIIFIIHEKINNNQIKKNKEIYYKTILKEVKNIKKYKENHYKFIKKNIHNINHLIAFSEALEDIKIKEKNKLNIYLVYYKELFNYLLRVNKHKPIEYQIYVTNFINNFYPFKEKTIEEIDNRMLYLMKKKSVYIRKNVFIYFCKSGNVEVVINILRELSKYQLHYDVNLLSSDLLQFKGNYDELINNILDNFNKFSANVEASIIRFLTKKKFEVRNDLYNYLISDKYNNQVNFEILKYFGVVKDKRMTDYYINLLDSSNEFKIIAIKSLKNYDLVKVRKALINNLKEENMQICGIICKTLKKMNLSENDYLELNKIEDEDKIKLLERNNLRKEN